MRPLRSLARLGAPQRLAASAALGALSALAQAPFGLLPVLLIAFPGLFVLLRMAERRQRPLRAAFATGFAFGFGAYGVGVYWVGFAFLVRADEFAWMIPILVPGLVAYLALYAGLAGWLSVLLWRHGWSNLYARVGVFAGAWSLSEVLLGNLFTGFPWNLVSQSATALLPLAQSASVLGPYGLSLVMVAIATLPILTVLTGRLRPLALSGGLFGLLLVFGLLRLMDAPAPEEAAARVLIVQPNVPQRDKLDPQKREDNLRRTVAMTATAAPSRGVTYALWPENTYPYLSETPGVNEGLAETLPPGLILATGTVRAEPASGGDFTFFNGFEVYGATLAGAKPLVATYDKHHLVPFGEYLPLGGLFRALGLDSLAPGGFTPGEGPQVLPIGPAPFAPLICYEDVFPGALYPRGQRPDWLVVVTNDAWFGDRAGPAQHLAIAQMRAIESGLPLARSANTGISALIDSRGRIIERLPLQEAGTILRPLPPPAARTLYDRFGELIWALSLCLALSLKVNALATRG